MTSPLVARPASDEPASAGDRAGSSSDAGKAAASAAAAPAAGGGTAQQFLMTPRVNESPRIVYIDNSQGQQAATTGTKSRAKTPPQHTKSPAKAEPKQQTDEGKAKPPGHASTGDRAGVKAAQPPPPKQAQPPGTADVQRLPAPKSQPRPVGPAAQQAPAQPQQEVVEEI